MRTLHDRLRALPGEGAAADVARAALLVAESEKAEVDVPACLARVDDLAVDVRRALGGSADAATVARTLCAVIGDDWMLTGALDDYYTLENSFLDDVIARRRGIPITLGVLYIAAGRRAGVDVEGVNFPSHFLVRIRDGDDVCLVDPFLAVPVTRAECEARLRHNHGESARLHPTHLAPVDAAAIVLRMLNNVRAIHLRDQRLDAALAVSDRVLLLVPDHPLEIRQRAELLERMGSPDAAALELQRLLSMVRDGATRDALRRKIAALRGD